MSITDRILSLFGLSLRRPTQLDVNRAFGSLVGHCPVCDENVNGTHDYWVVATAIPSSPALTKVIEAVGNRLWRAANLYEWDADKDSVQFTVIRCPRSERLGLVRTCHTSDLMSRSVVESREILDKASGTVLRDLAKGKWEYFG
jgi:hypothetical protein